MRVLNIMLAKARGGVEAMAVYYHNALKAEGCDVVSVGHPAGMLAAALDPAEFRPLVAAVNRDPLAALRLRHIDRDFHPDLILSHGNRATGLCTLPLMGLRSKTVQVMHNNFTKAHLSRVRAAMCVSASVLAHVRAAYPATPAVCVGNFAPLDAHPVKAAPSGVSRIGVLGRLHEQKGFDILLAAAARLRDAGTDFDLHIGGEGPERGALEAQCATLDLGDHVHFDGWQSPASAYMAGLDLFIVPSRYEPFGLVVIEAMAAGVPVIAADLEGPREILSAGHYGQLFTPEDPASLAAAIAAVLTDWPSALERAHAAQHHALETYGFAAGRKRLGEAVTSLARAPATS